MKFRALAVIATICVAASVQAATPTKRPPSKKQLSEQAAKARQVQRAKEFLLFSVEQCKKPDRCEPEMLKDAEAKFVSACSACAPMDQCEEARDGLKNGVADTPNPCVRQQ